MVEAPFNIQTEQAVLGSLFLDPHLISEIENTIKVTAFHEDVHKDIYKAILYLHYQNQIIDYSTVIDRLKYSYKKEKKNEKVPVDYILQLSDSIPSTKNFHNHAEMLNDLAHKRDLYEVAKYIVETDIKGVSSGNLIAVLNQAIENVNITSNIDLVATKTYANEWLEDFRKPIAHNDNLSFGYKLLDDLIMLENTNLGIIGARPSVGKSAYALNLAKNFCLQDRNVLFVSLEMSSKEVLNRLIANISGVKHDEIQRKLPLTKAQELAIEQAAEKVKNFNLTIYDKGSMTVDHLYNLAKKMNRQGKLDVLLLDYLQLMDGGKRSTGNDVSDISYISRKLKQLAQEIYIPVIALSQLSRAGVQASGQVREPQLSDLRQSGSIEQDANFVLMLHSEDVDDKFPEKKFITMFIRKNRSGALGNIKMQYYGDTVHFEEMQWDNDRKTFQKVIQKNWADEVINDINDDLPF
jgi:replicative DNA helicase